MSSVKREARRLTLHKLTLPFDARVKAELARAVECELFSLEESKFIAKRCKKLEHAAESLVQVTRKLSPYLEWLTYLIAVHCMMKQKIYSTTEDKEKLSRRRQILDSWFNIVYRLFKRLKKVFPNDEKIDWTIAEFLVRFGSTRLFDKFIQLCVLNNPRNLSLWMLAIDRQRQVGNIVAALRLAQRAYRFHQDSEDLRQTIVNLSVLLTLARKDLTLADEQDILPVSAEESATEEA